MGTLLVVELSHIRYRAKVNVEDSEWITPLSWLLYAGEGNVRYGLYDYLVSKEPRGHWIMHSGSG
jgi:hypothetical protein